MPLELYPAGVAAFPPVAAAAVEEAVVVPVARHWDEGVWAVVPSVKVAAEVVAVCSAHRQ